MEIIFSEQFRKDYKRIKDHFLREKIIKAISKLKEIPESGRPLRHELKGHRRLVIKPFRVVYRLEKNCIVINCFEHRKKVYK